MPLDALLLLEVSAPTRRSRIDGPGLATTHSGWQAKLTKVPDYGAVLVAITVAQIYLSGMLQRTLPAGFIAPCLSTKIRQAALRQPMATREDDGFRVTDPAFCRLALACGEDRPP